MFTRCLMVGTGRVSLMQSRFSILAPATRSFRSNFKNPYMSDPTPMSQEQRDD